VARRRLVSLLLIESWLIILQMNFLNLQMKKSLGIQTARRKMRMLKTMLAPIRTAMQAPLMKMNLKWEMKKRKDGVLRRRITIMPTILRPKLMQGRKQKRLQKMSEADFGIVTNPLANPVLSADHIQVLTKANGSTLRRTKITTGM